MAEIVRQYGQACIAALVALAIVALIAHVRVGHTGDVSGEGVMKVAGYAVSHQVEEDAEIEKDLADSVGAYTNRIAPPVSTTVATVGTEYRADELLCNDSGNVSVVAVNKIGAAKKVTGDVLYKKSISGKVTQMLKFDIRGRYIIRYRITDDAPGNEGASRNGTICVFVRKEI